RLRDSMRMTSAPYSARHLATVGPAAPVVSSTTRTPSSGRFGVTEAMNPHPGPLPVGEGESKHASRAQAADLGGREAQLAEDLVVVLADGRRRPPRRLRFSAAVHGHHLR